MKQYLAKLIEEERFEGEGAFEPKVATFFYLAKPNSLKLIGTNATGHGNLVERTYEFYAEEEDIANLVDADIVFNLYEMKQLHPK